jgi:hypothetical protein
VGCLESTFDSRGVSELDRWPPWMPRKEGKACVVSQGRARKQIAYRTVRFLASVRVLLAPIRRHVSGDCVVLFSALFQLLCLCMVQLYSLYGWAGRNTSLFCSVTADRPHSRCAVSMPRFGEGVKEGMKRVHGAIWGDIVKVRAHGIILKPEINRPSSAAPLRSSNGQAVPVTGRGGL